MYNIAATKPAINFTAGQFINSLPGATVKLQKKWYFRFRKTDPEEDSKNHE